MGEIARRAKQAEVELTALGVEPATVVALEALISEGKINDKIARQVLEFVLAGEGTPAEIVEARARRGLRRRCAYRSCSGSTGSNARRCRQDSCR